MALYYDIFPFKIFDLNDEDAEKNQIIIFKIENLSHVPLVSFVNEDLINDGDNLHNVEVYIPDTTINKIQNQIYISIPNYQCFILQNNEIFYYQDKEKIKLRKTKFNNYNYIEKSILDTVDDHQNILKQLVSQVKKITDHLAE